MNHKILKAALAVAVIGLPLQVQAYSITIQNAGFELPDTGLICCATPPAFWTVGGVGGAGVWDMNNFTFGYWTVPAPEGDQIAYISNNVRPAAGSPASLSQTLVDIYTPTIYRLRGYVGHPIGFDTSDGTPTGAPTHYTASLYAGVNLLASTVPATGPSGKFTTFNLFFDATGSAFLGQPITIRLESDQAQTGFDRISLTAVPDGGLTALLLGMGMTGLGWMRRKMN